MGILSDCGNNTQFVFFNILSVCINFRGIICVNVYQSWIYPCQEHISITNLVYIICKQYRSLRAGDAYMRPKTSHHGPSKGLSPGRHQAIIWTNAGILSTGPLGTKVNEILIEIYTFSFKKMHSNMLSAKRRPFCLALSTLTKWRHDIQVFSILLAFAMGIHMDSPELRFVFLFVSLATLLSKQSSCRWFQTPWRSFDVAIMTSLLNTIHDEKGKVVKNRILLIEIIRMYDEWRKNAKRRDFSDAN